MLIYKTFFKVMKQYKVSLILYTAISIFMVIGLAQMYNSNPESNKVIQKKYTLLIVDNDNSEVSNELVSYLESIHYRKEGNFTDDQIKDLLYYQNISEYIVIPEGFGDEFIKLTENTSDKKDADNSDQDFAEVLLDATYDDALPRGIFINMQINQYLNSVKNYMADGVSLKEASSKTADGLDSSKFVKMQTQEVVTAAVIEDAFQFLPFGILTIIFSGTLPVIMLFNEKEKKNRTIISSYKMTSRNLQLILGTSTLAIGVTTLLIAVISLTNNSNFIFTKAWWLSAANSYFYTISITLLLSMITSLPLGIETKGTANTSSFVTVIIGLSFAFLGGTFVDLEILGDKVASVARFIPNYWYSVASNKIWYENANLSDVIGCFGMELLFGMVCLSIGLVFTKFFREKAV